MKKFQVLGIGNAIVDVLTRVYSDSVEKLGIEQGIMQLVDRERAETLYNAMDNRTEAAGGSVANTPSGIGRLCLRTGFVCRVNNDALGCFYARAMENDGTLFLNRPVTDGELPTSRL